MKNCVIYKNAIVLTVNSGGIMAKAALHYLGCKVNAYETDAMSQLLEEAGYEIVAFNEKADVYIINTCSVTNMADRKSRQMLHRAKKLNPEAIVVATGCYVQTAKDKVIEDLSVDIVVGNNKKKDIVSIIEEYRKNNIISKEENIIDINKTDEYEELELETITEHTRAHLKIQDGCNNFCSYCIIPYARGRSRSRKFENIKAEIERLASQGFKEIVLTGIDLGDYRYKDYRLADVIEMADKIPGIERIRTGSIDPEVVTEDFVKRISKCKHVCGHFHLSLQSGCSKTLKEMNRNYNADEFYKKAELIRKYFDNPALTTDVIVGFAGESDEDYIESREFVKKVEFAELHVFKYSIRTGTVAAKRKDQVDEKIKTQRSDDLIKVGKELTRKYREQWIGKDVDVLFEEKVMVDNKEYWVGHTPEYIKVIAESAQNLEGAIITVTLIKSINDEIMLATI